MPDRLAESARGMAARFLAPAVAVICACLKGGHDRASAVTRLRRARAVGAIDPRDLVGRDLIFGHDRASEDHKGRESADKGDNDQPPDVPDQPKP